MRFIISATANVQGQSVPITIDGTVYGRFNQRHTAVARTEPPISPAVAQAVGNQSEPACGSGRLLSPAPHPDGALNCPLLRF